MGLRFGKTRNLYYRYKLPPYDSSWHYTKIPYINYTDLDPGQYQLIVEVQLDDGKWQKDTTKLHFSIQAHFTQTLWFRGGIGLILLLLIILYMRYITRQSQYEQNLARAEQKALRSQMKPHFLFNAINSVSYYVFKNKKMQALDFLQKFSKLMRFTLENAIKTLVPLDQDLEHLKLYMGMEEERLSSGSKYKHDFILEIDPSVEIHQWKIPPMIIQPLVENAIIHGLAPKEGDRKLIVGIAKNDKDLCIWVEDDGIGRLASQALKKEFVLKKSSQGLKILNQRLETIFMLFGLRIRLEVDDLKIEEKTGTKFKIYIPSEFKNYKTNVKNATYRR